MILLIALLSLVFSLIYLPAKIIGDIKAHRVGWAVTGGIAALNIGAQILIGLTLFLGLGKL